MERQNQDPTPKSKETPFAKVEAAANDISEFIKLKLELQKLDPSTKNDHSKQELDDALWGIEHVLNYHANNLNQEFISLTESINAIINTLLKKRKTHKNHPSIVKNITIQISELENLDNILDINKSGAKEDLRRLINKDRQKAANQQQNNDQQSAHEQAERMILEEILEQSQGLIHTSLPKEFSPDSYGGFTSIRDKNIRHNANERPPLDWQEPGNRDFQEVYAIEPLITYTTNKTLVSAEKKFLGMTVKKAQYKNTTEINEHVKISTVIENHSTPNEQAYILKYLTTGGEYKDYTSRNGNLIWIKLILPKTLALKLKKIIKENPKALQNLAKMKLKQYLQNKLDMSDQEFSKAWSQGCVENNNHPLSPPYPENSVLENKTI